MSFLFTLVFALLNIKNILFGLANVSMWLYLHGMDRRMNVVENDVLPIFISACLVLKDFVVLWSKDLWS